MTEKKQKGGVKKGHHSGGIRTLEDLKSRCVEDDFTGCWDWKLSLSQGKYPHASVYINGESRRMSGIKAALFVDGRDVPKGMTGYHHLCSNNLCMNPAHMTIGTHQQKWAHIKASGSLKGSAKRKAVNTTVKRSASKLTPHVEAIRASDEPSHVLAARLGCCAAAIRNIRTYRSHKPTVSNSSVFSWRPAV